MLLKRLLACGLGVYLALFLLTMFVPSPTAEAEAALYFGPDEIAAGQQYAFQRRLLFWAATGLEFGLLTYLVASGAARRWADVIHRHTGGCWLLTVLLLGATYWLLLELLQLPLAAGRFYHLRAWGMTERGFGDWLHEHLLYQGTTALLQAGALTGLYLLLYYFPNRWWLPATAGASLVAVGVAWLWPVVVSPLFNTFTPLRETRWAALEPRVRRLVDEAGLPVREILVMDASRQSNHSNAYFAGFGPSRRIVLFDTLLHKHTPEEVESVLAHEIGHWQHDHIVKGLALGTVAALVGLFVLSRLLLLVLGKAPLYLRSPADPAGLPLIILLLHLGSWLALPAENAVSRYFERQADRTALDLAGRPEAFIDAEKRLARTNLGNVAPAPWNVWLFATHPPTVERIRMAAEWREQSKEREEKAD